MAASDPAYPTKTREMHSHHFDSTIWNDFGFRDDDIILSTYAKAGPTCVHPIDSQLLLVAAAGLAAAASPPRPPRPVRRQPGKLPAVEAQTHRRFIKTHLPVDALVFSPKAKYLYIARDGRDVVWSMYNHHVNANAQWYEALNDTPGRVGPPIGPPPDSVLQYFDDWLARDGHPFWPFWENLRSWWAIRHLPNVMMLHFGQLKADMPGQIRRIAAFLDTPIDEAAWPAILEHCSFDYMKANASASVPLGGAFWEGGARTFIHKGVNGRWRDLLSPAQCAAYEARALAELGADCARWLATGEGG